jgi:hypothetical protein
LLPGGVDVVDAQLDEHGAVLAGHRAAAPSIPTVAGAPMAMVPAGVLSSAKTGTGRVAGRPVTCAQKVARRSTSSVMTRTETKSMAGPFASEGGGVVVAVFAFRRRG